MTRQSTVFSASNALAALGKALGEIKAQDGLTWADMGAVLGVSDDQAAKYAEGSAAMNAVTYGRGKQTWNGRFTGYFDRLCEDSRPNFLDDRACETTVLEAVMVLSRALADGKITVEEVRKNRASLENARDAIDAQLGKIKLASA